MAKRSKPVARPEWLTCKGPGYPLVLSSRARIARNLDGLPFPCACSEEDLERARGTVLESVAHRVAPDKDWQITFAEEMTREQLELMAEEHVTSPNFGEHPEGRAIAMRYSEGRSIAVNEEDHVRIQSVLPGAQLEKAWRAADELDGKLEGEVRYAFDQKLGYLTSCPSNVGTGLRLSSMLHLPALMITGDMAKTMNALLQAGVFVRGLYGEGAGVAGNVFQLSNRRTLGQSEESIASFLDRVVSQVVDNERTVRKMMMREDSIEMSDRVWRALGVVERARKLCFFEALELLSLVKLGVDLELLPVSDFNMLDVIVSIAPYHVRRALDTDAEERDVDVERAPRLRMLLEI
jgi:protein arginine kinase